MGAMLFGLSWMIGASHVSYVAQNHKLREVGFWAALNWSVTSIAIWPAMFCTLCSMLDAADRVFADIDKSPMTWLGQSGHGGILTTWHEQQRLLQRLILYFATVAFTASALEWWFDSAHPLFWGTRSPEYDWSAIRPDARPITWSIRAAFSLAAFVYQGLALTFMLTFAAATILIARAMGLHGSGHRKPPLLIDIESNDSSNRVGFERFMIIIDYMIVFVALAFANFFLTRVQNAYLHDPSGSPSLGAFVAQDFVIRKTDEIGKLFVLVSDDFSSVAVGMGAFIGLFLCFFFFNATLRHSAMEARNRSDHVLIESAMLARARRSGLELTDIREKLRSANVWPLGYSDLMPTLAFLTICLVTIIFFRIGIYLAFLWIAGWIVARTASGLVGKK
jgi:hypothetical protein